MSETFYEIARWRLDEQLGQIRELNSRLAVLFTATTALLVLFATFQDFIDLGPATIALLAGAAVIYLVLVFVIFLAYADRRLNLDPDLRQLQQVSRSTGEVDVRAWSAEETMRAVEENDARIRRKGRLTTAAQALWAVAVSLLGAATLTGGG